MLKSKIKSILIMADFSDNLSDLGLTPDEKSLEPGKEVDKIDSLSKDNALVSLKKRLLGSKNKNDRLSAAWELGKTEEREATKILLEAAKSETDIDVKDEIISALGWLGDQESATFLVGLMAKDDNSHIRRKAAWALSHIQDSKTATDSLVKVLLEDEDQSVRQEAAWSLGELGCLEAESSLADVVLTDESAKVRKMSVWALGQIKGEKTLELLLEALEADMSEEVRREAAWVWGREKIEESREKLAKML